MPNGRNTGAGIGVADALASGEKLVVASKTALNKPTTFLIIDTFISPPWKYRTCVVRTTDISCVFIGCEWPGGAIFAVFLHVYVRCTCGSGRPSSIPASGAAGDQRTTGKILIRRKTFDLE
jgi:hypothetical protein